MKILLIRTAPLPVTEWAIQWLKEKYPECRLDVLTRSDSADHFQGMPAVNRVISYPHEFFDFEKARDTVLPELKKQHYDIAAFIYNNPERSGYSQIHAIVDYLESDAVLFFDADRTVSIENQLERKMKKRVAFIVKNIILMPPLKIFSSLLKAASDTGMKIGGEKK